MALSELNQVVLLIIIVGFPRVTANLLNNDSRQTCLRNGKTLNLCTKFFPLCDKQVIASALGQLRINFTCIFKVFQFCENFENTREINP